MLLNNEQDWLEIGWYILVLILFFVKATGLLKLRMQFNQNKIVWISGHIMLTMDKSAKG